MHRIISFIASGIIAFSAACSQLRPELRVIAYEQPTDIHLIIETKEIYINDIPDDRIVSLDIYTENCPPYSSLVFLLEKDSRLEYQPYHYLTGNRDIENMIGLSFTLGSAECPDFISCMVPASRNDLIDHNGLVARANLILPDDAAPGDFYSLSFLRTFTDRNDYETQIKLANNKDAKFGESSFSELYNGGILITAAEEPVEPPPPPTTDDPVTDPEPAGSQGGNDAPPPEVPSPGGQNEEPEQVTQTAAVQTSVTTEVSSSVTTVVSTVSETAVTSSQTTASETAAATETTAVSETAGSTSVRTEVKPEAEPERAVFPLAVIIASAAAICGISVVFIYKKRK